jgi:hypothetical protein
MAAGSVTAVDETAIATYIGDIERVLADGSPRKAFVVKIKESPLVDLRLPIWDLEAFAGGLVQGPIRMAWDTPLRCGCPIQGVPRVLRGHLAQRTSAVARRYVGGRSTIAGRRDIVYSFAAAVAIAGAIEDAFAKPCFGDR